MTPELRAINDKLDTLTKIVGDHILDVTKHIAETNIYRTVQTEKLSEHHTDINGDGKEKIGLKTNMDRLMQIEKKKAIERKAIGAGLIAFIGERIAHFWDKISHILSAVIIMACVSGCANVSSTRMLFKGENTTLILDMPKEVQTKNLKVVFNAQQGTLEVTSDTWISQNQGTIDSQSGREKAFLESSSVLIEKATEGAVRGAMKGVVPIP